MIIFIILSLTGLLANDDKHNINQAKEEILEDVKQFSDTEEDKIKAIAQEKQNVEQSISGQKEDNTETTLQQKDIPENIVDDTTVEDSQKSTTPETVQEVTPLKIHVVLPKTLQELDDTPKSIHSLCTSCRKDLCKCKSMCCKWCQEPNINNENCSFFDLTCWTKSLMMSYGIYDNTDTRKIMFQDGTIKTGQCYIIKEDDKIDPSGHYAVETLTNKTDIVKVYLSYNLKTVGTAIGMCQYNQEPDILFLEKRFVNNEVLFILLTNVETEEAPIDQYRGAANIKPTNKGTLSKATVLGAMHISQTDMFSPYRILAQQGNILTKIANEDVITDNAGKEEILTTDDESMKLPTTDNEVLKGMLQEEFNITVIQ